MSQVRPGVAIAGLGMTDLGRVYGVSQRRLAARAVRLAADDAGLAMSELDGLLICPGVTGGLDVGLAAHLGLRDLSLLAVVNSFGASATMAVQTAALAITSGTAQAVACVFADVPLREGVPAGSAFGSHSGEPQERHGLSGLAAGYGYRSVTAHYALAARRHMQAFGTASEQLGAIAVAQRQWAAGNPRAQHREPITIDDHQRSRWVAEPLHLLDCSVVSNGAVAVIVTTAERARSGSRPPVHVWGWGQAHPGQPMAHGSQFGLVTGAVQAGRAAMAMAGVSPAEITMCQLYDCYTYTVLVTLEDYGFCAKGEGGELAASGALAPGGSLPVNTGGGQLSGYYMWGFTPLSEAIMQARGDGGERQSAATDLIIVSGNGGVLAHHGTLIVSPHAPAVFSGLTGTASRTRQAPPPTPARMPSHFPEAAHTTSHFPEADVGVIRADARSAAFFAAAARGELLIKRCGGCGLWLRPTESSCPRCGDDAEQAWAAASGRGTLVSWSVVHSRDGVPVAMPTLVELAEGPWLATALSLPPDADPGALRSGQPVTVAFARPTAGECYPVFCPLDADGPPGHPDLSTAQAPDAPFSPATSDPALDPGRAPASDA
jgi:acetyl-CoA acetyltransferase/uncharacterized OB-fold protein